MKPANPVIHNRVGEMDVVRLRDLFAAFVVAGWMAHPCNAVSTNEPINDVVARAFEIADAMLAERER